MKLRDTIAALVAVALAAFVLGFSITALWAPAAEQ
jgi:hypothetical protein